MKWQLLLVCFFLIFTARAFSQKSFEQPLSSRTNNYQIKAYLDTDKKQVKGSQRVTFKNPSSDTIWTLPFHMYYNAFKNNKSIFNTGYSRIPRTIPEDEIKNGIWGWIEVTGAKDEEGSDLEYEYIHPDIDNKDDHTVLEIRLKNPVLPFDSCAIQMEWLSQIPKSKARTGYSRDFYFMVQWYPKMGVYEPAGSRFAEQGQWNCHQYHPSTEYFGEFGVYEVELDVPSEFKTGGSGFPIQEKENGDRKKITYLAEDVIDFAWTANPGFIEIVDRWKDVEIKLLIMPEHVCNQERFLKAAKNTLEFYENYLEKYPYPTLTIVSPPFHGLFSGAMEYPTLITSPTLCDLPSTIKTTETLTIHELTHQYFMQMVATNEQEEPWMDEGFTSFFEAKILDKYYPEGVVNFDFFDVKIGSEELRRGRFMSTNNPKVNPLSDFGFHFKHGSSGDLFYGKAATGLMTLEGLVGEDLMQEIMQTYFKRWKFKHPCRNDFLDVVGDVVYEKKGEAMADGVLDFMNQLLLGTDVCDYSVESITNFEIPQHLGFFENTDECKFPQEGWETEYLSKVILFRNEGITVPQEIRIVFDNGDERIEYWDGKKRSHEFIYQGQQKIECVEIDPTLKIPLDHNLINNSYTVKQKSHGITRAFVSFITWMENVMVSASGFI